jgi:tripartite ATP-independent transporter DctM subunit
MLVIGVPIAVSIGLASVIAMLTVMPFDGAVFISSQQMFKGANSFPMMAIPFFVLAGNIMNNGGIALRLVNAAKVLAGRLPAPLAHTNIIANALFGAISGSGCAACAAIGGTMGPIERDEGYDPDFVAAVNICSAPAGMLIPPSNTLIVYSMVAGSVSVSALFIAGYGPGILWMLICMGVVAVMAARLGYKAGPRLTIGTALKTLVAAIPSLFMIVIVIGGILAGIFTATEGSAIAVVYSFILSLIYRSLTREKIKEILVSTVETTVVIMLMICVSSIMSYFMAYTHIPDAIGSAILGITHNKFALLLIMNVLLLFIGMVMDPTPAILIFTPILLPICRSFGMDPVQFGIVITMNMCIGCITPPVGTIMFTGVKVGKVTIESVVKKMMPFFICTFIGVLLVTYIPAISLWLPTALGLIK